jgi:hypothetical protein
MMRRIKTISAFTFPPLLIISFFVPCEYKPFISTLLAINLVIFMIIDIALVEQT